MFLRVQHCPFFSLSFGDERIASGRNVLHVCDHEALSGYLFNFNNVLDMGKWYGLLNITFVLLPLKTMGVVLAIFNKLFVMKDFPIGEVRLCNFLIFLLLYLVVERLVLFVGILEACYVGNVG